MKVSAAVVLAVMVAALAFSIRLIGDASFTERVPISIPSVGTPAEPQRQARPVTIASRPDRADGHGRAPAQGAVAAARHADEGGVQATPRHQHKRTSAPVYRRVDAAAHAAHAVRDDRRGAVAPQSRPAIRPRPADTATDPDDTGSGGSNAPSKPSDYGSGGSGSGDNSGSGCSGSGSDSSGSASSGSGTSGSGDSSGSGTSGSGDSSGSGSGQVEEDAY